MIKADERLVDGRSLRVILLLLRHAIRNTSLYPTGDKVVYSLSDVRNYILALVGDIDEHDTIKDYIDAEIDNEYEKFLANKESLAPLISEVVNELVLDMVKSQQLKEATDKDILALFDD